MRTNRFLGLAAFAVLMMAGSPALAFHDGGVAYCAGCHTMHNSPDNPADNPDGNPMLLRESTPSDVCLRCHATRLGNIWGQDLLAPGNNPGGGQFIFLTEDNINDGHAGAANPILGHQAGHNILSDDKGMAADPVNDFGPGGAYQGAFMHCTSCHDPHGQGGHFRLLYGNDFPESKADGFSYMYTNAAPTAVGAGLGSESNANHTAFQAGMSEWCGNCHGEYHNTEYPNVLKHPSGSALGAMIAANYSVYNGTGDIAGGLPGASYLAQVPFEADGMTTDYEGAPDANARVMCLSCHRAHASSGPNAGRWDFNITIYEEEGVESSAYAMPNPYPVAGIHQRSLCNKCHSKDP